MIDRDPSSLADIHSHLVPGVDDGARTLQDTMAAVERFTQLGVRKIITTPHIEGSLTLDPTRLDDRLSEVSEAWNEAATAVGAHFPEVTFERGHEVMLDVPELDFSDPRIRLAGTSFVLIEWPRLQIPPGTTPVVARIVADGYRPIVAHPERYFGVDRSLDLVNRWRLAGAYLQVNYGSLEGRYGVEAKETAFRLLRRGWVDYLSSDFHAHEGVKIYKKEAWAQLEQIGGDEALTHLSLTNTARVFRDERPLPVPLLPPEVGFWARVKTILNQAGSR